MTILPNNDDILESGPSHLEDYKKFAETADTGLFTRKTRRRLVGKLGLTGRDRTKYDFWLDQRNRVKNALKDLEIFLMVAGSNNVKQTFTFDNVKPLINAILWNNSIENNPSTNIQIARIAQYLVESGFMFLTNQNSLNVTIVHERAIKEAIDISRNLSAQMIPMEERTFYSTFLESDTPIDHKTKEKKS